MLVWISRREWEELESAVKELVESKRRAAARRDLWLVKVIPTVCTIAIAYGTVQTLFIK